MAENRRRAQAFAAPALVLGCWTGALPWPGTSQTVCPSRIKSKFALNCGLLDSTSLRLSPLAPAIQFRVSPGCHGH